MKSILLIVFMVLWFGIAESATTYYVDNTTNGTCYNGETDYDPGTEECDGDGTFIVYDHPQDAANIVNPGDVVIVKYGNYTDVGSPSNIIVSVSRGGTEGNVVTFKSETKWGAVLDGEGYSTNYGWFVTNDADYIRFEDFEVKEIAKVGFMVNNTDSDNLYFYGNHVHHIGRVCSDSTSGNAGFFLTGDADNTIYENNVVHHVGRLHPGEEGCDPETDHWQNVDHGMYLIGDTVSVFNNIFYDNVSGWDIAIKEYATDYEIINNTFDGYGARAGQILLRHHNDDILIQNNILNNPKTGGVSARSDYCATNTNIVIKNNLTSAAIIDYVCNNFTYSNNIEYGSPDFVDDYHLGVNSDAKYNGLSTYAPEYDHDWNYRASPPSIGAYAYCPGLVMRESNSATYNGPQPAYNASSTDETLLLPENTEYIGAVDFDKDIEITVEGGLSCDLLTHLSDTIINGDVTISSGTVIMSDIEIF